MSKPVRLAVQDGLITPEVRVLDFGCGHGEDMRQLGEIGVHVEGWDPVHRPHGQRTPSHVVNLGYVLNVIESPEERMDVIRECWGLTERVLIVSARCTLEDGPEEGTETYGDGYVTRLGSFQKFYEQSELRQWIHEALGQDPLPMAPGIFLVFRDESLRETWRAQRFRRRVALPRVSTRLRLFQEHKVLLESVMAFFTERGRLPQEDEFPLIDDLRTHFGSFPKAFQVIRSVTGLEPWTDIQANRRMDLLVWLALTRFHMRPQFTTLPIFLQRDIKSLFSAYTRACEEADNLLMSIGKTEVREEAISKSPFGKLMPKGLYVHIDYLDELPPVLRLYEGCARAFVGGISGANLIKFHRDGAQVSYLTYEDFDRNPHPELLDSVVVSLDGRKIRRRNYKGHTNRFILHRKETFIPTSASRWETYHRLTAQEEKWGLYVDPSAIGTQAGWQRVLNEKGCRLVGHRLARSVRQE
jgi:DNA phosphorothioation-associated putative methyltransferase